MGREREGYIYWMEGEGDGISADVSPVILWMSRRK